LLDTKGVIGGSAILPAVNQVVVIHRGPDFVLKFLDLDSGRTIRQATVETPAVGSFATMLTPASDGRRFMVLLYPAKIETGEPMLFQLWDAQGPVPMAKWEGEDKGCTVHAAAWLDDSRYVVNAHHPTSDSRFHLVLDVNQPGKVRRVVAGNDDVAFSFAPVPGQPDQILTHLRGGGLAFYDLAKSAVVRRFSGPRVQRQLIFLDAQRVLGSSDSWGDALRLWDTTSGRLLWELKDERLGDAVAVSPDGRFAVTNSWVKNASGQNRPGTKLLVWRLPK
jgi:WD40 repeat protein